MKYAGRKFIILSGIIGFMIVSLLSSCVVRPASAVVVRPRPARVVVVRPMVPRSHVVVVRGRRW